MHGQRAIVIVSIIISLAAGANAEWIKVNGGYPLDNGQPLYSLPEKVFTAKNARGDLFCFFNYLTMGTVARRLSSGGSEPTKRWDVFTDGAARWSNDADAIGTSISGSVAVYVCPMNLFALPGSDEGLFGVVGVSAMGIRNSTRGLDMHGYPANIVFDGQQWQQWNSQAAYGSYYLKTLIPSWNGNGGNNGVELCDFAFDPQSQTGILIAEKGYRYGNANQSKLAASKYVHGDNSQRWHRWDSEAGGWTSNYSWPGDRETGKFHILNPNASNLDKYHRPQIVHLASGDYLVVFELIQGTDRVTSAARYNGENSSWSWWNGQAWEQGGSFKYGAVIDEGVAKAIELFDLGGGKASLFYTIGGKLYERSYDESGAANLWETSRVIANSENYCAAVDDLGTEWLYYSLGKEVYLQRKSFNGAWQEAVSIYSATGTAIKVLGCNFVNNDQTPVCFIAETNNFIKRIYAISDQTSGQYWADEQALVLDSSHEDKMMDPRILVGQQVFNRAEKQAYSMVYSSHLAIDGDGYIYSPESADCKVIVRHKDELDWRQSVSWGGFWDHFRFSGGAAVDNLRGKVYVTNQLIGSGGAGVGVRGNIKCFDMYERTQSIGYSGSIVDESWLRSYSPQIFPYSYGDRPIWPGDAAVNEKAGLLYVTSSVECKVQIYDVNNTVDKTGAGYRFKRSYLESGFSGDNLSGAERIVEKLIQGDDLGGTYLSEYAADANYVYWAQQNAELEDMIWYVEGMEEYAGLSSDYYRDRLIRQLSLWYKYYHDEPAYFGSDKCIGGQGSGEGEFKFPQGIDVDPDGNIYVVDTGNHRIQKFDSNGDFVMSWGELGRDDGEFIYPFSVSCDKGYNLVYVTDPFNRRVQIFDRDGNFIYSWSKWESDDAYGNFNNTYGISGDGQGNIYAGVGRTITKFSIAAAEIDGDDNGIPDTLESGKVVVYAQSGGDASIKPNGKILVDIGTDLELVLKANTGYYGEIMLNAESMGIFWGEMNYKLENIRDHQQLEVITDKLNEQICWYWPTQCHGDANLDGVVNTTDFAMMSSSWLKSQTSDNYNPCADFNRDGSVNTRDWPAFRDNFYQAPPADCPLAQNN